jgi:nucleotide-binding universal stress UspA family protein
MDDETCLVVGVDASPESLAAVEWAMRLAGDLRRPVLAVHAVGLLEGQHLRPHPDVAATVAAARALNGRYSDVEVETMFEVGAPAEIITRIADDRNAVLIVVGSRGLGQATQFLGSTSEAVLARATIPVLIVPAGSSPAVLVDDGADTVPTPRPSRSSRT